MMRDPRNYQLVRKVILSVDILIVVHVGKDDNAALVNTKHSLTMQRKGSQNRSMSLRRRNYPVQVRTV